MPMVDLKTQYQRIKDEIDRAVLDCIESGAFIKGPPVAAFEHEFADFQEVGHVISCGNGTDALQLALMGLGLGLGDEVIVPAFTYVATAEVVALLGLTPVLVDVDPDTFNVTAPIVEKALTDRTRAVVPVHLYGQCCDMAPILELCRNHDVAVVEDAAQATGAEYTSQGVVGKAGSLGTVGCTSFFPTKNLGCYGDGGALMTNDSGLAERIRMVANHGQNQKYHHAMIGVNSRLDSIQAAILRVKLRQLNDYIRRRQAAAAFYDEAFAELEGVEIPFRSDYSTQTFHQYTLKVRNGRRDALQRALAEAGIPSVVYYPLPLHRQEAFKGFDLRGESLEVSERLCTEVVSLPLHTELASDDLRRVTVAVRDFFE